MKKECCDECGTALIDMCYQCGAPVCCPRCCAIDNAVREAVEAERGRIAREVVGWLNEYAEDVRYPKAVRELAEIAGDQNYTPTGDDDE